MVVDKCIVTVWLYDYHGWLPFVNYSTIEYTHRKQIAPEITQHLPQDCDAAEHYPQHSPLLHSYSTDEWWLLNADNYSLKTPMKEGPSYYLKWSHWLVTVSFSQWLAHSKVLFVNHLWLKVYIFVLFAQLSLNMLGPTGRTHCLWSGVTVQGTTVFGDDKSSGEAIKTEKHFFFYSRKHLNCFWSYLFFLVAWIPP